MHPRYYIGDGKTTGPLKKHLRHLQEFERHPQDKKVLKQGSCFSDRVFLSKPAERKEVLALVSGGMNMTEFTNSDII